MGHGRSRFPMNCVFEGHRSHWQGSICATPAATMKKKGGGAQAPEIHHDSADLLEGPSTQSTASHQKVVEELRRNARQWRAFESKGNCDPRVLEPGRRKSLTAKMALVLREEIRGAAARSRVSPTTRECARNWTAGCGRSAWRICQTPSSERYTDSASDIFSRLFP